jgi:hypothetical protein
MMTMLEASCLEKHQGDQRFSESLQFLEFTLGWAGRQKEYPCIPVCRFSFFSRTFNQASFVKNGERVAS